MQQGSKGEIKDWQHPDFFKYTALSFFINEVDYNEALICNIISCYKTLNIPLRIYHDF